MTLDDFTFEESAWELTMKTLKKGDEVSAARFLTLLEGETEEVLEDAFRDTVNLNGCIELSSGDFPVLKPGSTRITFGSGITKVDLIPRWWCL